jgi:hypothetical protein
MPPSLKDSLETRSVTALCGASAARTETFLELAAVLIVRLLALCCRNLLRADRLAISAVEQFHFLQPERSR